MFDDLNAGLINDVTEGSVGQHGMPGRNESGERLLYMSAEQQLVVGNNRFRKKDVFKYTWLRLAEGMVVDRALMDKVLLLLPKTNTTKTVRCECV